jgi:Fanconi anemia group M protein
MKHKEHRPAHVEIYADEREPDAIRALSDLGALVHRKALPVADFVLSGRTAAERKTRHDFEQSVFDGRLFDQAKRLTEAYERVVLIVEGEEDAGRMHRNALLGAYSSLITDYGISLFFTQDIDATAELLFAIAKHEQLAKKQPLRVYARRKALTLSDQQKGIIESLPNVGPKLASELLDYFGNVENVMTAPESELAQVGRLGEKRAKSLRKVVLALYDPKKDTKAEE